MASAADSLYRMKRLLTLIPFLRENEDVSMEDLARYLDCKPKEIVGDLDRILLCGVPPYLPDDYINVCQENQRVSIRFADHFKRPVRLTVREALSLKIALDSLPRGGSEAAEKARRSLLAKIERAMRRQEGVSADAAKRVRVERGRRLRERVDKLEQALRDRREVVLEYYSAGRDERSERPVHPYGIIDHRDEVYLVAWDEQKKRVLHFRADRIKSIRVEKRRYEIPEGWKLEREPKELFHPTGDEVEVRVRFDREMARWAREEFPTGTFQAEKDGSVVLKIAVGGTAWLVNEVLRYGPHAEILSPPDLRATIRDRLLSFLARGASKPRP